MPGPVKRNLTLEELADRTARGSLGAIAWFVSPALWFERQDGGPSLFLVSRANAGDRKAPLTLGTAASCDVVLPFPSVSEVHAQLLPGRGDWKIEDLSSKAGTSVEGRALQARTPTPLELGARVVFGEAVARFCGPDALWHAVAERLPWLAGARGNERRRAGRLEVDVPCALVGEGPAVLGRASDLSMIGARVQTVEACGGRGDPILFSIPSGTQDLVLEATVVRSARRNGKTETALRFTEMPPAVSEALAKLLAQYARGDGDEAPRIAVRFEVRCATARHVEMLLESISYGGVEVTASHALAADSPVRLEIKAGGARGAVLLGSVMSNRELPDGKVRVQIALGHDSGKDLSELIDLALSIHGREKSP